MRHRGHHLARERGDDGQNHDGQDHPCRQITQPGGVVGGKEAGPAQQPNQDGIQVLPEQRHQHEHRPQSIDHAGNGRQQLGEESQRPAQRLRAHLGEENSHANGQGNRQQQSQKRGDQCAINKRQGAEMPVHRVPVVGQPGIGIDEPGKEKVEAEAAPGQVRALNQLRGDQNNNAEDAQRAQQHQPRKTAVGDCRVAAREQKPANRRFLHRRLPLWRLRLRLKLRLGDAYLRHVGVHLN